MLINTRDRFSLKDYKKEIGKKTNIHKVSYFFKEDLEDLHNKRILVIDFEFSMNKIIFEVGGFVLEGMKVVDTIFEEYQLPEGEPYWSFEQNSFVTEPALNTSKREFNESDKERLFNLIDSVDYVVVHNYVAEAQCLSKLQDRKYSADNCDLIQNKKFICTCYSFKNKYFKNLGLLKADNNTVSEYFGWELKDCDDCYKVKNKEGLSFKIKKPKGVESKLHNSYYDSVITLTNLISLKKILK